MYRFQFENSFQDMRVLNRVAAKAYFKWATAFWVFAAVVGLLGTVMILKTWDSHRAIAIFELVTVVLLFILMLLWLLCRYGGAWFTRKMQVKDMGEQAVTLDEDGVHVQSQKAEGLTRWDAFCDGFYCRERYLLFIDRSHAFVLPKQALVQGDVAMLKAYLEEKLGKEIKEIH